MAVVTQFDVVHNPRYLAEGSETYCSTFVWDVTRAMGAEIPHWVMGRELNANSWADWLLARGAELGWTSCSPTEAVQNANHGRPAIGIWKNLKGGHGHVVVILPTPIGPPTPVPGTVFVAQAGTRNFVGEPLAHSFGALPVTFYRHD